MAVIERIGSPGTHPYVVAWGRLTEEDEERLLARVADARSRDITVDLCEVEEVTDEGCVAIRNVADQIGRDQTMVVLYVPDREATRSLERSGIADDGRIVLVASSRIRRVGAATSPQGRGVEGPPSPVAHSLHAEVMRPLRVDPPVGTGEPPPLEDGVRVRST